MERTYVFNSDGGNGGSGGSKLDITAMLPGMFGNKGIDPNLLALMNNGNGFGGQDGWWSIIWLVVIASIFGWNGNGGGLFGGRGGDGANGRLQNCESMNALTNTMNNNALSLRDGATANTNAILAKLDAIQNQALQDKTASLTAEKATLTAGISQRNQNATILSAVGQQIAPLAAGLQALQSDVDGIKCKLPNTVSVQYPNLTAINTDCFRAAAYGAYMGDAVYGRSGCGCNNYRG